MRPVSDKNISWFHCGRCGSLFESPAGQAPDRLCPSCGLKPSLGLDPLPRKPADADTVLHEIPPSFSREDKKTARRKPRGGSRVLKFVVGWLLLLLVLVVINRMIWTESDEGNVAPSTRDNSASAADAAFLINATPLFSQTLQGFMQAETPGEQNQFVVNANTVSARMLRFQGMNSLAKIDPAAVTMTDSAVVHLQQGKAIAANWSSTDGHRFDTIFFEENGQWLLDWDHYVRYSDYPWSLFLAGSGTETGEFRLLARERLAEVRKNATTISLTFHNPLFGRAGQTGSPSPEFLVSRDSENGRLLTKAFQMRRNAKRPFGATLPVIDPEDFIRVRVKIQRVERDRERSFEILDTIKCHWLSVDESGLDGPEPVVRKD